ncbi:MAG: A/G-specific adenine glycosylase [Armatimonadota bacterium]|nr:A/G-specific adenine glycosylase [Armatimonadota bacterium]MDR7536699.1 A/G-specific adenine glycosylase [Armatimonadota bacterium]
MLQQTQVPRVIPKYREFLRAYPSIRALAAASVDQVRETWYPLGYNIRPVWLHAIAREVVTRFGGRIPGDRKTLLGLKGIGPYTAAAVLAFAHERRVPLVDVNVRRVLQRVFYGLTPLRDGWLWQVAGALLPRRAAYDFNQALMDLGATVCVARTPHCPACPMRMICRAYPLLAQPPGLSRGRTAGRPGGRRRARPGGRRRRQQAPGPLRAASGRPSTVAGHRTAPRGTDA